MTGKKKVICLIAAVLLAAGAFVGGFFAGKNTADTDKNTICEVVYAEILDINDNFFHVKGLEVNDVNGRDEFTFSAKENTRLVWRGTEISLSDFNIGDKIAFYYSGAVLETFPAQIPDVRIIKLLEDEK
ncbi:MAG TPA: DUF3221 domain-containing protein [Ruminococcaceae bacterium]|nr:DUF3221 domain-containing protein [Oscillospiraceae bacterium]